VLGRRQMLMLPLWRHLAPAREPPTDPEVINRFVAAFNAYTAALVRGELGVKLWSAVEQTWKDLQ
jgi:hypothetical protein